MANVINFIQKNRKVVVLCTLVVLIIGAIIGIIAINSALRNETIVLSTIPDLNQDCGTFSVKVKESSNDGELSFTVKTNESCTLKVSTPDGKVSKRNSGENKSQEFNFDNLPNGKTEITDGTNTAVISKDGWEPRMSMATASQKITTPEMTIDNKNIYSNNKFSATVVGNTDDGIEFMIRCHTAGPDSIELKAAELIFSGNVNGQKSTYNEFIVVDDIFTLIEKNGTKRFTLPYNYYGPQFTYQLKLTVIVDGANRTIYINNPDKM
jgi:hypothetical protein